MAGWSSVLGGGGGGECQCWSLLLGGETGMQQPGQFEDGMSLLFV